ncbi:DUF397 domain-containing protein [Streptomyces sp. NBC_01255]|uniref:DUF397 domain-containing protein n=1 Tax=Streptomyces sp. NBC_01255 TaxID=2903798 RepID=UPI002E34B107|nr:DUF397 domain-containing protein [Streptomyces sp. NBC_01255]
MRAGSACHSRPPPTGRSITYGPASPRNSPTTRATWSSNVTWRKSSYSNQDGGQCLEVVDDLPLVPVRDSKVPAGPALLFEAGAWASFVDGFKGGQLSA